MNDKIMIVEDSPSLRNILQDFLTESGYSVSTAENGEVALNIMRDDFHPVILTDLEMPIMDGTDLIDSINSLPEVPVVMVLTAHNDSELIVEIMKKGVFDYLIKPVKKNDLLIRIQNAVKLSELNRMKKISEKEKILRLENQLEWYKFQDRLKSKKTQMSESMLFENLQRSLNQGSGLGTLISLIDIFTATARKKGDVYEIDERVVNQIADNQQLVYQAVRVFSEIEQVTSNKLDLEPVFIIELYNMINTVIKEMDDDIKVKNHKVILSESKSSFDKIKVAVNMEYFRKVVHELIINALKYSEKESTVMVILEHEENEVLFSIINTTKADEDEGIPLEYENIIFEPFFRKAKYLQEEYKTLDYGLGLTLVEKIIQKHNGRISLYNIEDYSDFSKNPETKVNCRVTLPIAQKQPPGSR